MTLMLKMAPTPQEIAAKQSVLAAARGWLASNLATIRRLERDLGVPGNEPILTRLQRELSLDLNDAALATLRSTRDILDEIEWAGSETGYLCPVCACSRMHGHQ